MAVGWGCGNVDKGLVHTREVRLEGERLVTGLLLRDEEVLLVSARALHVLVAVGRAEVRVCEGEVDKGDEHRRAELSPGAVGGVV